MNKIPQLLYMPTQSTLRKKRRLGVVTIVLALLFLMASIWYLFLFDQEPSRSLKVWSGFPAGIASG